MLSTLSKEDSAHLIQNLLAIEGLPAHVRELILGKADGNPFFLEEIIRNLIEGGSVVKGPAGGRWKVTVQVEEIAIPDTIQGVITARIDRLDEAVKRVLRTAAVIGRSFLHRVLRAVVEGDPELDERLTGLQTAELIREKQRLPELEYVFKHALAQEAIYESILLKRRRELHAQVGRAIERLFADRVQEFYGLLAYHYAQAEEWELAQDYLLKAGDQSGRVAAGEEALARYRQAVAAYERAFGDRWDPLQRASIARKMGEAYYAQGQLSPSREQFLQSLKMLGQAMPTTTPGILIGILGQALKQALRRLWPAVFLPRDPGPRRAALLETARTYIRLHQVMGIGAEVIPALYAVFRSLDLAEAAGPSPELAQAYVVAWGNAVLIRPFRPFAGLYRRLAHETAEGEDDLSALAYFFELEGMVHTGLAHWSRAFTSTRRAAAINDRIGHLRWWEESWGLLAVAQNLRGDFAQAVETWQEVYASAHERGDKQVQLWSLCGQATAALRRGQEGHENAALALLKMASALLAEYAYAVAPEEIRVRGLLAQAYLREGNVALALQAAESATASIRAEFLPTLHYVFEGYVGPPLVYLTLWEAQENGGAETAQEVNYREAAWQACKGLRRFARTFPVAQPRWLLFLGGYNWLAGKPGKAWRAWRKCLSYAEELNLPYEQGLAHYEIGRHLEAGDAAREEDLAVAVDLFSQLDAAWDLARAQEALTGS